VAVRDSRDGVLPEEVIDDLVGELREPSLLEPLKELRRQRLRKTGRSAADAGGRYAPVVLEDEGRADDDDGGGGGGGSAESGGLTRAG